MIAPLVGRELAGCKWVGVPFAGGMSEIAEIDARSIAVNESRFADFVTFTIPRAPPPNQSERSLLDESLKLLSSGASKFRRIPNSLSVLKSVDAFQKIDEGDSLAWGRCCGLVDCSAPLVLAYLWSWNSRERMGAALKENGSGRVRDWRELPNSRSAVLNQDVPLPPPFGSPGLGGVSRSEGGG
jgi:hypothetical protein